MRDRDALRRLGRTALPILAILSFAFGVMATLAAAGDTLGFDFLAYYQAAIRMREGLPLYDMSYTETGGFGLFYYPPTFAPFLVLFWFMEQATAVWVWIGLSLAAFVAGTWILPVSRTVRWWVILLAGWSFPFVYAVKLGQVGPILFALFAVGWRWIDSPWRLGGSGALGAAIKLQPGLILVWALFTKRYWAVAWGAGVLAVLAVAATVLAGPGAWTDFLTLLRAVSDPISTEHNFTPGAVIYQLGVPTGVASSVQLLSTIGAIAVFVASIRWATEEASYLVAVVASQLISPIVWDHYAMLLLLPVAYLLAAGRWWALAIPLATAWPLVGITPAIAYPIVFWATLLATVWVGIQARRAAPGTA